jgi:hypothetical protein
MSDDGFINLRITQNLLIGWAFVSAIKLRYTPSEARRGIASVRDAFVKGGLANSTRSARRISGDGVSSGRLTGRPRNDSHSEHERSWPYAPVSVLCESRLDLRPR